jgi:hypothetical protein
MNALRAICVVLATPVVALAQSTLRPAQPLRPQAAPAPMRPGTVPWSASEQGRFAGMVAQHQRVKARLTFEEQSVLDRLTASVKRQLFARPLPPNLLGASTQLVSMAVPGLSPAEAVSLAEYVLGGIAAGGTGMTGGLAGAGGGDSSQALLAATQSMQETQMSFNLQYLQLQSQMQQENRSYTAISNIMKTKHDTVKNSVGNIR